MAAKKYATIEQAEAIRKLVEEARDLAKETRDVAWWIWNAQVHSVPGSTPPPPPADVSTPPPVESTPPPTPTTFPWGHITEHLSFDEAVGTFRSLRDTYPQHQLSMNQVAWEIGTKWPDYETRAAQSSIKSWIRNVMDDPAPPA